ncbi:Uncharacterised protein g10092 [Pycnogonum litorale]
MAEALPSPVRVSPFIKFCRWGALTAGVIWGVHRYRVLSKKETAFREIEAKRQVELTKHQEIKKLRDTRVELLQLAKDTGVPIPEDFDKQYPEV